MIVVVVVLLLLIMMINIIIAMTITIIRAKPAETRMRSPHSLPSCRWDFNNFVPPRKLGSVGRSAGEPCSP